MLSTSHNRHDLYRHLSWATRLQDYVAERVYEIATCRAPEERSGGEVVGVREGVPRVKLLLKVTASSRALKMLIEDLQRSPLRCELIFISFNELKYYFWAQFFKDAHRATVGVTGYVVNCVKGCSW